VRLVTLEHTNPLKNTGVRCAVLSQHVLPVRDTLTARCLLSAGAKPVPSIRSKLRLCTEQNNVKINRCALLVKPTTAAVLPVGYVLRALLAPFRWLLLIG